MIFIYDSYKVGCVFSVGVVSILPRAKLRPNDHHEDAPHFRKNQAIKWLIWSIQYDSYLYDIS